MVIKDSESLQQVLALATFPVRYSDEFSYRVVSSPEQLAELAGSALKRNSIAIVVPVGQESLMENFPWELRKARSQRRMAVKRLTHEWLAAHPRAAKRYKQLLERKTV